MSGTGVLTQVYVCPTHGDVDGLYFEDIDVENDEIYPLMVCSHCGLSVAEKKTEEGVACMRELEEHELMVEWMLEEDEW